ncbi:MAG: flagellar biosynthesis protein FlhA [Bdellovibrionales bacterium]|nr:flagellar biosynthesis protein FlhA [Bdellovibrionales bacterium]
MNDQLAQRLRKFFASTDIVVSIAIIFVLLLMIMPLSPFMLDIFYVISIMTSLGILLLAVNTRKPLDFSIFPTVLLVTTLFRLSLNVASTRLILSDGHKGTGAAGHIIKSFGDFVMGGNYVVGFIVFVILVIINFVVITKGSGRISEVAARFTLDALPGKQMAIDADLSAGLINESEAKKRRATVEAEADFYGSMDGASKFVRGDAVAGIMVTIVNIVGGLIIGTLQRGLDVSVAAKNYTLLTVGDGLVSQVPALVISTAAGLVVTRAASGESLSEEVSKQLFFNEKVFFIIAGALFGMGLFLPGTLLPFWLMGAVCGGFGYLLKTYKQHEAEKEDLMASAKAIEGQEKTVETASVIEPLQLEVGYGLISIVDSVQKGDLLDRIQAVRKQFAQDLGIIVPPMNIRDNLQLRPGEYVLLVRGVEVARGDLMVDHFLAMDPGGVSEVIDGIPTKEPVFGLDAVWIHENNKELAQLSGYTVVDISTVIATHITEIVRKHAHELIGRQEVQVLVDFVHKSHPKVIDELIPKELSLGAVVRVLQSLLREQVPIRDLVTIFEALADAALTSKEHDHLVEQCRVALGRTITRRLLDEKGELPLVTFARNIEEQLISAVQPGEKPGATQFIVEPSLVKQLIPAVNRVVEKLSAEGVPPVILVTPMIRHHVKKLLDRFLPQVTVLSHNEIHPQLRVRAVGNIEV